MTRDGRVLAATRSEGVGVDVWQVFTDREPLHISQGSAESPEEFYATSDGPWIVTKTPDAWKALRVGGADAAREEFSMLGSAPHCRLDRGFLLADPIAKKEARFVLREPAGEVPVFEVAARRQVSLLCEGERVVVTSTGDDDIEFRFINVRDRVIDTVRDPHAEGHSYHPWLGSARSGVLRVDERGAMSVYETGGSWRPAPTRLREGEDVEMAVGVSADLFAFTARPGARACGDGDTSEELALRRMVSSRHAPS